MEKTTKPKIINLSELVGSTLKTYRANWQKFAVLLILPLALSFFINLFFYAAENLYGGFSPLAWLIWGIIALVFFVVFLLLYFFAYISQFLLLRDLNQEVNFSKLTDWYKKTLPYFWPIVLVSLVYLIFTFAGFVALIIPGVIIMVYYSFTIYAVMFEENKFEGAFGKSRELVRGYWWAVFGRFLFGLLLMYLAYSIIGAVFWVLGLAAEFSLGLSLSKDLGNMLYNLLSVFIGLIAGPLSIIYSYKIYNSLKEIKKYDEKNI